MRHSWEDAAVKVLQTSAIVLMTFCVSLMVYATFKLMGLSTDSALKLMSVVVLFSALTSTILILDYQVQLLAIYAKAYKCFSSLFRR